MGADDSALWVALLGVGGTLGAAALTQVRADRLKKFELAHARKEQERADARARTEQEAVRDREDLALRKSCYVVMNTSARQFMTALVNYRHALQDGGPGSAVAAAAAEETEARRAEHGDSYSEAQMVVPDPVLDALRTANTALYRAYGTLKRINAGAARPGETLETAATSEDLLWDHLAMVRLRMRRDLGIASEGTGS